MTRNRSTHGRHTERVWHGVGKMVSQQPSNLTAMHTPAAYLILLKRRARRFLLKGDLERYLNTLKELHEMRVAQRRALA